MLLQTDETSAHAMVCKASKCKRMKDWARADVMWDFLVGCMWCNSWTLFWLNFLPGSVYLMPKARGLTRKTSHQTTDILHSDSRLIVLVESNSRGNRIDITAWQNGSCGRKRQNTKTRYWQISSLPIGNRINIKQQQQLCCRTWMANLKVVVSTYLHKRLNRTW